MGKIAQGDAAAAGSAIVSADRANPSTTPALPSRRPLPRRRAATRARRIFGGTGIDDMATPPLATACPSGAAQIGPVG